MIKTAILLLLVAVSVEAGNVRINYYRCDKGRGQGRPAANACRRHFCPTFDNYKGFGVNVIHNALDSFSACQECWEQRCEKGESQYCADNEVIQNCRREQPAPGAKVAVIGGGISGLFAARQLKLTGYDVTVYEAEDEVAGTTESLTADGRVFDFATKYVMPNTPLGPMQATMKQMIKDFAPYGVTLRESVPSLSYWVGDLPSPAIPAVSSLPHGLLQYVMTPEAAQLFVSDLIFGQINMYTWQAMGLRTPEDFVNAGIVAADESYGEFAARFGAPGFTDLLGFIHDGFLQGSAMAQPAALVLNVRRNMLPPLVKKLFLSFGITSASPPPPGLETFWFMITSLVDFTDDEFETAGSSWTFENGMQHFFDSLVQYHNLNVYLSSPVHTLRFVNNQVFVNAKGRPAELFDYVVMAVQPHQAIKMLRFHPEMQNIYDRVSDFDPKVSWAVRAESGPDVFDNATPAPIHEYASFLFPDAFTFPTDGSITAVNKDWADSNVVFGIGYSLSSNKKKDLKQAMLDDLEAAGYTIADPKNDVLHLRQYDYPVHVDVTEAGAGWFADAAAQQGIGNMFYVGEIFSGPNIPNLLDHVERVIPQFFPAPTNKDADVPENLITTPVMMNKDASPVEITAEQREAMTHVQINPQGDLADLLNQLFAATSDDGEDKEVDLSKLIPTPAVAQAAKAQE